MPVIDIATPFMEGGIVNPAVAPNTFVVTGSGFLPNAQIQGTITANGVNRSATVSADAQGNLNHTFPVIGAKAQQLLNNFNGADFNDNGTSWSCGLGQLNGDAFTLTMTLV